MRHEILELGKVVNTHGIRGELKIQPWCDEPELFHELEYFYINGKKYEILRTRIHKNCIIAQVEGISSINEAELLKNCVITIERDALGELPDGTYYIADLEGLEVHTLEGKVLGRIDEIIKTGSNDVYVLKETGGKPVLIPVIEDVVKEVNVEEGYVLVELLKGLID
ncbi:MAG: 16S rRNA processing protein RimM [Clostridia bacterium]|nr:16S rRNA processing protein RimM [Clostridia bacterium]